jgi:predicted transposase/invertase (TIGR01784 family)
MKQPVGGALVLPLTYAPRRLPAITIAAKVFFNEHSPVELVEEVIKMDTAIQAAQDKLDMIARDPDLLRSYEQYEKAASDWTTGINEARRTGEQSKAIEVAKTLKAMGDSSDKIARATGLSLDEIAKL